MVECSVFIYFGVSCGLWARKEEKKGLIIKAEKARA